MIKVNNLAEKCARIALRDQEHLRKVIQHCHIELDFLEGCLKQTVFKRVKVLRSEANFLICELPIDSSSVAVRLMKECGIFVAPLGGFGLNQWIRVSPGTRSQNEKFLNGLRTILEDFEC